MSGIGFRRLSPSLTHDLAPFGQHDAFAAQWQFVTYYAQELASPKSPGPKVAPQQ